MAILNEIHSSSSTTRTSSFYRDFVILFASMFSLLAGAALSPALPAMAAHFASVPNIDILVKMTLSLTALFIALGAWGAGMIVDAVGRKPVLIAGIVITAVFGTLGAFLDSIYFILLTRVLLGLGVAAVITSATTLIGDLYNLDQRSRFLSKQSAAMKIGGILFLFIGGALAGYGWRAPFLIDLLAFAILPLVLWRFEFPPKNTNRSELKPVSMRSLIVLGSLSATFASQLFFYMVPTQLPFLLTSEFGAEPSRIGAMIAMSIGFSAISASQFHRMKRLIGMRLVLFTAFPVMGIGYLLIGYVSSYPGLLFALGLSGLGLGLIFPAAVSILIEHVGEAQRGKAIGILMSATFAGQFISPLLLAPVIHQWGFGISFAAAGALLIIYGFCSLALFSKINS
jgi:MFS family permease